MDTFSKATRRSRTRRSRSPEKTYQHETDDSNYDSGPRGIGAASSGIDEKRILTQLALQRPQHSAPVQRQQEDERRLDLMDLSTDNKKNHRKITEFLKSQDSELNTRIANHSTHKVIDGPKYSANQDWGSAAHLPSALSLTYPHNGVAYSHNKLEIDDDTACMEVADAELFQAAIIEHATLLGIDPEVECDFLWIAKESLIAPLPEGWHAVTSTESGEPYYYSEFTGESRWDHPCDEQFRQLFLDLKKRNLTQTGGSHKRFHEKHYTSEDNHFYDTHREMNSACSILHHDDPMRMVSSISSVSPVKKSMKALGWMTDQDSTDGQYTVEELEEQNAALKNTLVALNSRLEGQENERAKASQEVLKRKEQILELESRTKGFLLEIKQLQSEAELMSHAKVSTKRPELMESIKSSDDPKDTTDSNAHAVGAEIDRLKILLESQTIELKDAKKKLREFEDDRKILAEAQTKATSKLVNEQNLQEQSAQAHSSKLVEEIRVLRSQVQHLETEKRDLEVKKAKDERTFETLRLTFEEKEKLTKSEHKAIQSELVELRSVVQTRSAELAAANNQITIMSQEQQKQELLIRQAYDAGFDEGNRRSASLIEEIRIEKQRAADLYTQELRNRRKLHNRLMELQGNIRVFCRVRPISAIEVRSDEVALAVAYRDQDPQTLELHISSGTSYDGPADANTPVSPGFVQKHVFEFDHVFKPDSTQMDVFEQTRDLVVSALDGFNVCIFAYGQTGSGKTYTMEGSQGNRGVNYRALQELFRIRDERLATGNFECSIKLSILEVYNETIIDLLETGLDAVRKGLDIRVGKQGIHVENLKEVDVFGEADILESMHLGHSHRSVGSHDINEHSSRSHLVLSIKVETVLKAENRRLHSTLHLIDLAGSERVSKTAASGQRLKEAQNINRSLSALGDVISALGSNSKHVPYRNSKLTFLLQDSLSGNSKVLMFVNVSPVQWNSLESLCSLNFASRCRSIALGHAKANNTPTSSGGAHGVKNTNSAKS